MQVRIRGLGLTILLTALALPCAAQAPRPFLNVTEAVGLKGLGGGTVTWIDFDDDGHTVGLF